MVAGAEFAPELRSELLHEEGCVQLAGEFLVEGLAWSPSGRSVAVLTACPSDAPLAWTPDGRELIVAIHYDDCGLSTRDRSGRATPEASLWASEYGEGTVKFSVTVATGTSSALEVLEDDENAYGYSALGTAPQGMGIVASGSLGLVVIPLDTSPVKRLPRLVLPTGTTEIGPAAAGFFTR